MMNIRPLRTEADYDAALAAIQPSSTTSPIPARPRPMRSIFWRSSSPITSGAIGRFDPPDPVDATRYRMETGGFSQADLGRLLGSRQRASDILNRKRPLTVRMAKKLHREWGVPAEALLGLGEALPRG
jgi:HTH-type transcriptional regulator/antitoxin HigA